jgi:DNA polymerase-3 subunit alpha
MSFFANDLDIEPVLGSVEDWSLLDSLHKEESVLCVQISAHPLDEYYAEVKAFANFNLSDKREIYEKVDTNVKFAALIIAVNKKISKAGEEFAILSLQDKYDKIDAFCGVKTWANLKEKIFEGTLIMANGKLTVSSFNNRPQIMISSVEFLDTKLKQAKVFYIEMNLKNLAVPYSEIENFFKESNKEKGCAICIYAEGEDYKYKIETSKFKIAPTRENLKKLNSFFGNKSVWIG